MFSTKRPTEGLLTCHGSDNRRNGHYPTFLYESIWCFLLFILMYFSKNNRRFPGQIVCLYGILYSVERFFVEGLRTDSP
ncbi:MAG: prolipoprotein diacylglyceryl transferase family protein [Anaerovoracaceae bacterium]